MPTPDETGSPLAQILSRPLYERIREHRYRFAQALVFGLPVLALEYIGPRLGGSESARWIGLFQALLAGWILYVAATGMIVEALLLRRLTLDATVSLVAVVIYGKSLICWISLLTPHALRWALGFHWPVIVLILWTGFQWLRLSRQS